MTTFDWQAAVSRLLKAELAREGLTLAELAARLSTLGVAETEASVKNKLFRGSFSAAFLLQCCAALDRRHVDVETLLPRDMPRGRALDS